MIRRRIRNTLDGDAAFQMSGTGSLMTRKQRFRNVGAGKGVKEQLDPVTLSRLHIQEKLSQIEIARRFGCSPQFVCQLVAEYGLKTSRRRRDPQPPKAKVV
jgi:hypothetical protein